MSRADVNLEQIFEVEIQRLRDLSQERPLNDMDIRKLDMLTRAWKTYNATDREAYKDKELPLSDDELIALAKTQIKV